MMLNASLISCGDIEVIFFVSLFIWWWTRYCNYSL